MGRVEVYAEKLWEAERSRVPITSFANEFGGELRDAYAIQGLGSSRRLESGDRLVGYKIGLTSLEAQKHFGISHPDFGHLFNSMNIPSGGMIELSQLIQPKIEAEIAFILGSTLKGPGVTPVQAREAVQYVVAALEIIDSRFEKWKINAFDTIADNGSSARFVLSEKKVPLGDLDLRYLGMALSKNGEVQLTAAGAAVMGDPVQALCFLANELSAVGKSLEKGQIILSGSLGGMLSMKPRASYDAEIRYLGRVSIK